MIFSARGLKFMLVALATTTLATGVGTALVPQVSQAQTGFTIFGGIDPAYRLSYFIDANRPRSADARYYLQVGRNKVSRDVIALQIEYPKSFTDTDGEINPDTIEIRQGDWRGGQVIPVKSISLGQADGRIDIIPDKPIPKGTNFVVVLSKVRNPSMYGYHYFNLRMTYQGDVVDRYVGTWPLELGAGD
ncbi:MAG: DUF2808 domain-containing protein [Cyanobacteria bacterium REEB459]|nr:DUF2808 domain-containing protein [Cyanobacteria bacterium REEB459]